MNRRGFLSLFGATTAAAVIPSALVAELWAPSRTIFLPPTGGWAQGNLLLSPQLIVREALRVLHKNLSLSQIEREYDDAFFRSSDSLKVGDTLRIRMPARLSAAA